MPSPPPRLVPLAAALAVAIILLGASACSPATAGAEAAPPPTDAPPPLVHTAPVEVRQVRREIETTGYLEAEHQVQVLSKVPGRLIEVAVDEGDPVAAGAPLARLDDREAEAALRQVQAQLADRKTRAALLELEIEASQRREVQARIDRDRTAAELERLKGQDAASVARKTLEEAEFAVESAEQALQVAGYERKKAVLDRDAAKSAVAELEARVEESQLELAEHRIVAPIDGVVTERWIDRGQTISTSSPLFDIVDPRRLVAHLSRPQVQLPLVRDAKEVIFTTDAFRDRNFTADIDLVSPIVDKDTGHFEIRMRVRPEDVEQLRPGMFIRARILTEAAREALMVPKAAVLPDGEQSVVFAIRDHVAFRIPFDPGLEEQTFVEARARGDGGLLPGDEVVVAGQDDLRDQMRVEVE